MKVAPSVERTRSRRRRAAWNTFLLMVAGGVLLLIRFNERFVFSHADLYAGMSVWALAVLTPVVVLAMRGSPVFERGLAEKYPTAWLRRWITMPLMSLLAVGAVLAAPVGWLSAAAAWSGGALRHVDATAVKVESYAARRGCDQRATLRFASADKETCLDGLAAAGTVRRGQLVDVGITEFPFGFFIASIARAAPAGHAPR